MNVKIVGGFILFGVAMGSQASRLHEIGVVVSDGNVSINQKILPGNATLFNGSMITSSARPSTLLLSRNLRIDFLAGTSGVVYDDRLVLHEGVARAELHDNYVIDTDANLFRAEGDRASMRVRRSAKGVEMTVEQGQMEVLSRRGFLLARVNAGDSIQLQQASSSNPSSEKAIQVQLTGKLEKNDDRYFLLDRATKINQELTGKVPANDVGKVVTVLGEVKPHEMPHYGAERVVEVRDSHVSGGGFPCFGMGNQDGKSLVLAGNLREVAGHFLLADQQSGVTSELVGNIHPDLVGKTISVKGLYKDQMPYVGADQVIAVEDAAPRGAMGLSTCQKAWIGTAVVTATATGVGLAVSGDNPGAISR